MAYTLFVSFLILGLMHYIVPLIGIVFIFIFLPIMYMIQHQYIIKSNSPLENTLISKLKKKVYKD